MTALSPMRMLGCAVSLLALTACDEPLDFDLRSIGNGFDTTNSVQSLAPRPEPDNRGVISYPGYQVAIAQRGDTVEELSQRLRVDAREVARFNGLSPDDRLRAGEVVALPTRVAEPSPSTGAIGTGPIQPPTVDVTTLAGDAIDRAQPDTPTPAAATQPQTGFQPTRHRVAAGETAFSISRLYNVPVQSLAEWNSLGNDFAIREGQILLIPVGARDTDTATVAPGTGSPTPTPPSSTQPLPEEAPEVTAPTAEPPANTPASPQLAEERTEEPSATFIRPVEGRIIRAYAPGRNEGIDVGVPAGTEVKAAGDGQVAAVTQDTNGVTILVIRHSNDLLTVYTNIEDLTVSRGDTVTRGQSVARVRASEPPFLHFEVRRGLESVDPEDFLP